MTSALIVVTEKMTIVGMVLDVVNLTAFVCNLEQHFYNTDRAHKIKPDDFS
jgi:hypothetical protein